MLRTQVVANRHSAVSSAVRRGLSCATVVLAAASLNCREDKPLVPPAQEALKYCADVMQMVFPKSTTPIAMEYVRGLDDVIYLKLRISPGDGVRLIQQSPFATVPLSTVEKSVSPQEFTHLAWWDVDRVRKFQSAGIELPKPAILNLLIDRDDSKKLTIYLEYWEM